MGINFKTENINEIFKKKADYFEEVIKAFTIYRSGAYGSKIKSLKWLGDFSLFTIFGLYDIWILQCDYEKSIKVYQQNYYARQTALLCFELLSDIPQNINENYQKLLIEKIINARINEDAKLIRKRLNQIRSDRESDFKDIRDRVTAHREHDISNHIDIINKMDNFEIMKFALEYMKVIEELNELLNEVIAYLNKELRDLGNEHFIRKYT